MLEILSRLQSGQTPPGLNSPRPLRKLRAGSVSAVSADPTESPATRRRRSRVPSSEDQDDGKQLLSFLQAGEKNLSATNLGKE